MDIAARCYLDEVCVGRLFGVLAIVGEHLVLDELVNAFAHLGFLEAHARHVGDEFVQAPETADAVASRLGELREETKYLGNKEKVPAEALSRHSEEIVDKACFL